MEEWKVIETDGLPQNTRNHLWQFRGGREFLIGYLNGTKITGQFHTEFDLIRFEAWRELPAPYESLSPAESK